MTTAPRAARASTTTKAVVLAACESAVSARAVWHGGVDTFSLPTRHRVVSIGSRLDIHLVTGESEVGYVCAPEGAALPAGLPTALA
jgi:hypothetical protein